MSAHVLLYLLNELGEKIKCEFNKFNNTGARMQDSIYHMTLRSHFISDYCTISPLEKVTFLWTSTHNVTK